MSTLDRRVRQTVEPALRPRYPVTVFGLAGLTIFVVGGLVGLVVRRNRRAPGPIEKVRRLGRAVARMLKEPDRVARPTPGMGREVLSEVDRALASRR